jgi:hypothetical protein
MTLLARLMAERAPVRKVIRVILRRLRLGSYAFRLSIGAVERPHYAYIIYQAASLARRLRLPRISVLEFGVAGGAGLLCMERHAGEIEKLIPEVKIEIYGFDTGAGLPPPADYRDMPYHWKGGFFAMDPARLREKLTRATLIIGDVAETVKTFTATHNPAPVGAMSHDLDYYSSTAAALDLLKAESAFLAPRIFCYFDDTLGSDNALFNDYTGERLAIAEFNAQNDAIKLSPPYHLRILDGGEAWKHQIWIAHSFGHPLYNTYVSGEPEQLPL